MISLASRAKLRITSAPGERIVMRPEVRQALDTLKELEPNAEESRTIEQELTAAGVLTNFREYGRKGGLKLKRERGPDYYKRIGKKGGRPPLKKKAKRRKRD